MICDGLPRWLNGNRICLLTQETQQTQVWSLEEEMATHSSLKNSMDRGAWLATVHGVAKGRTWLSTSTVLYWEVELQPLMWSMCLGAQSYLTLWPHGLYPTRLLCPWGFSRQEYCSGLSYPPPGDLPNPEIEPRSPAMQGDSLEAHKMS